MSYQVLARRWRPQTFAQMVGQEHVLRALVNALERNRLHHAYLLTGTRGVGKTTLARLIAKCLNCEQGISASPCGECGACREIAEGRFVDLLEIDAASRTKVEDTRDLLENVQYAPARGRFKVYLIDEVHMLSTHSFNALLKTLEEPPPHVKFLLATTDPQKLPATVLSRCLQLHLKNLSPEQISAHLAHVLHEEAIDFEEPALWELAVAAEGSMRDALSLTDQAIAHGAGNVTTATVTEMLGYIERELLRALVEALLRASAEDVLSVVADMAAHGADFERALAELLAVLHRVALAQTVPATLAAMHAGRERFAHWAALASPADVQLYYQIGLMCRRDLPYAPDARSGLEMALLRMLAFRPAQPADARIVTPERATPPRSEPAEQGAVAPPKKPEPAASGPAGVRAAPRPPAPAGPVTAGTRQPAAPAVLAGVPANAGVPAMAASCAVPAAPATPAAAQPDTPPAAAQPDTPPAARLADVNPGNWHRLLAESAMDGMAGTVASHCLPQAVEGATLQLLLPPEHEILCPPQCEERIAAALTARFGHAVTVRVRAGRVEGETPAARATRIAA
ncbi:MAG: DNA polymerase III subunit gamma/tau, partial [Pseudomonadales bacterium]|nr:DNA polymerase III subunit gamma/tau [Pseudomonadales bacterium]